MTGTRYKLEPYRQGEWRITLDGRAVFYGTLAECKEWLEINGHDDWN